MTQQPFDTRGPRRSRLRALALGLGAGLCVVLLAAAVGDVAGRLAGADHPPLRVRVRRLVTSSPSYMGALEVARTSPVICDALGGEPTRVDLDACSLEDDADRTRMRFTLRLEGSAAGGRLDVVATYARGAARPAWVSDVVQGNPAACFAGWVERRTFTRDGAPPVDLTVTLPAR